MPAASARRPERTPARSWDVPERGASQASSQRRSHAVPTPAADRLRHAPASPPPVDVDVVVPVFNEQAALGDSVRRLHAFLTERFPFTWRIVIADNASTDGTPAIAARAGRGAATASTHCAWSARAAASRCARRGRRSDARVVAYMDVDLSTDLRGLLPLVAPLL